MQGVWVHILSQEWLVQRLHLNICCTRRPYLSSPQTLPLQNKKRYIGRCRKRLEKGIEGKGCRCEWRCMRAIYIPKRRPQYFTQSSFSHEFFRPLQLYSAFLGLHSITRVISTPKGPEHLLHSPSLAFMPQNVTKYPTEKETSYTPLKVSWDSDRKEGVRITMNRCRTRIIEFLY